MNKESKNGTKFNRLNWKLTNNVYCLQKIYIYRIIKVRHLLSHPAMHCIVFFEILDSSFTPGYL